MGQLFGEVGARLQAQAPPCRAAALGTRAGVLRATSVLPRAPGAADRSFPQLQLESRQA
jgi:hypothetical protein